MSKPPKLGINKKEFKSTPGKTNRFHDLKLKPQNSVKINKSSVFSNNKINIFSHKNKV